MDLDRQPVPTGPNEPPQRVPETKPPLLGDWFIYLSVVVLFSGVIAISALELGNPIGSAIVKYPTTIGAAVLTVVSADAALRTWRSAFAWLPIDRRRSIQRFVWTAILVGVLVGCVALIVILLFDNNYPLVGR
jgi:hypothetical protein